MRLSFHVCASQPRLTLLALVLLLHVPGALASHPRVPPGPPPRLGSPDWGRALLQLQAALDTPERGRTGRPDPREPQVEQLHPGLVSGQQGAALRAQRGVPVAVHSPDGLHYPEGGEDMEGSKRNEALTSIAGGLQAFSRQKGGFGFRFGRKRHTGGRRRRDGRSGAEEEEEKKWN